MTIEEQLIHAMDDTAAGVQVAHLSSMSFVEQVQLFRGASLAVGVH
eukprot:CAMPEP_0115315234 /NCGR_PEP_ID=MMETSP0270-20121206/77468_1 /TAXON_ID=71861 /ORGANISM="Scrippsiella trochoidea, Strain CCMP3099" /LENGTH=45 /DNA_ID= /DNA_START= /DNA_END= /DNA_ORIENTATION=